MAVSHTHTHTGHPLTLKQENIGIKGWAVEARVYAEVRQTSYETGSEICSMLEVKYATYHLALFFLSPLSLCIFSIPLLPCPPPLPSSSTLSTPLHFSLPHSFPFPSLLSPQDPVRFLPSIGYLSTYKEPTGQPGLEKVLARINI